MSVFRHKIANIEQVSTQEKDTTECDFTFCAPECCQKFRTRNIVLFVLSWSSFAQSMFVTGFVKSAITSLERRFNMSSKEAGCLVSFYNIGNVLALLPISYYGGEMRRLRCFSCGMFLMSIGSLLCALPHVTGGPYEYKASIEPNCYRNENASFANICDAEGNSSLNRYKFIFWFALTLVGVGCSPLYTVGLSYIDDNNEKEDSDRHVAIFYASSLFGPAVGFILAALFLQMYVDIGSDHPGLENDDTISWVGAYWIGFVLSTIMCLIPVVPLYGFPKELPGSDAIRAKRVSEAFGSSEEVGKDLDLIFTHFFQNLKVILMNRTFVCIAFAATAEDFMVTGLSTFMPKYLETIFRCSSQKAVLIFGGIMVPSGALGVAGGGYIINHFRMNLTQVLRFQAAVVFFILPLFIMFLIPCGMAGSDIEWAGITTDYDSNTSSSRNLSNSCNIDCKCMTNKVLFKPVCGSNSITYYSPCYAGCSAFNNSDDVTEMSCSCIPDKTNASDIKHEGPCTATCPNIYYFLGLFTVIVFLTFLISTPAISATMRCLPEKQKTLGLGVQWIIIRSVGSIPGPLVWGGIFDNACALTVAACGGDVKCTLYDPHGLQPRMMAMGFLTQCSVAIFLCLAWFLYKPSKDGGDLTSDSGVVKPSKGMPNASKFLENTSDNVMEADIKRSTVVLLSAIPHFPIRRIRANEFY